MTDAAKHTLYICYFGLREPLVQTQVIPYLTELMRCRETVTPGSGDLRISVSLVTFEPAAEKGRKGEEEKGGKRGRNTEFAAIREKLAADGIDWHWLPYHKRPSAIATAYDVLRGAWFIRRMIRHKRIDVLHGRIHVATLMGAIARKFSLRKPKLIFDIRGFFPEEYTDAGIWPEGGLLYRAAKRVERWLMKEADGFVVLTEKARTILFPDAEPHDAGGWFTRTFGDRGSNNPKSKIHNPKSESRPVEVIPCCVDFERRFPANNDTLRETVRAKLGVNARFVVTHVGALGGLYLTEEIVDFLVAARSVEPTTFALFLTQTDPEPVISLLQKHGFEERDYFVGKVDPAEIPDYLSVSTVGLSFVKATYATQSRSPTKIPEYLAAGLPIIANSGVGDVDKLITEAGVGVLIDKFEHESYLTAFKKLKALGDIGEKCRRTAREQFDLETVGGVRYRRLYQRLMQ